MGLPVWSCKAPAFIGILEVLGSGVCVTQTDEELEATKFKLLGLCHAKKKKNVSIPEGFEFSRFTCLADYTQQMF